MAIGAPFLDVSIFVEYRGTAHVNERMQILLKANYSLTHQVGSVKVRAT